jgi:hypothetical protein|tara:strand:+ start:584 stop:769 length:186 start_codon:yes stop_codon:yes gene_type:complete
MSSEQQTENKNTSKTKLLQTKILQTKRMLTIIEVAGLLGVDELKYIKNEIGNMITDIERKD